MSQAKVDKYKQEKYNRKHAKKKKNIKKYLSYAVATLVAICFIGYLGYSVAVATGLYTPPTTTVHIERSEEEIESIRNVLIQSGDSNVQTTTAASSEETTVSDETTTVQSQTTQAES
jgi:cytoskeletal protein RodZ